jgi:hypothetical protein
LRCLCLEISCGFTTA